MATDFCPTDERAALVAFLDAQRAALLRKVEGLGDEDARRAPTASSLSLLSLLRHATLWEERWFQGVLAGQPLADGWPEHESEEPDADFLPDDEGSVQQWVARYEQATEVARRLVADRDLDARSARPDVLDCTVRWLLLHLIEETARHAGHADILRESIDGSRGL